MKDRAIQLIKKAGPRVLSDLGGDYYRWKNISSGRIRVGAEEISILAEMFPEYALWLVTGNIQPEAGHRSPEYDEANKNLPQHHAG